MALGLIVQQVDDCRREGRRIAERHQHAPFVGEHFFGIPIRRRNHGFARAHRIRERTRNDLRRIQVGRNVDIGRADELHKLFQADELVVENDLLFDALFLRQPLQGKPISLTVLLSDVGVSGADDEINHIGVLGEDLPAEPI